jgi:hypothetical protein
MEKIYHGSCHCGAVHFEAAIDLAGTTSRCNCSICTKARFWKSVIRADAFRLLDGADALTEYRFGSGTIHHFFCGTCGVKPFGRVHMDAEYGGQPMRGEFYAVNVACLDDATVEELANAPIVYEDGKHDDYEHPPAETRYL